MTDADLCYLSASQALSLFRARKLSPVELLQAQIARAEKVEPVINAFSHTFFDRALAEARRAESRYMRSDGRLRRLEGLTVAVKDTMDVKGQHNTQGSLLYKDHVATSTHPLVERLLKAGAIIHARSTIPEFCCAWITASRLFGTTRNPWNPDYFPCGSSGGSAAALAAGTTMLATGTDIGGSIRGPAAACGIVGFKPPYGRVPDKPPMSLDFYSHVGPMARTVTDCALMEKVIAGVHPHDIATLRQRVSVSADKTDIKGWRIAFAVDLGNGRVAPAVEENMLKSLGVLKSLGAEIEQVELGWGSEVTEAAKAYLDHLFGRFLMRALEQAEDKLCDYTVYYAKRAGTSDEEKFLWSYEIAGRMYDRMGPLLDRYHAFICPTLMTHEIKAEQKPWDFVEVAGRQVDCDYGISLMHPFNMLSRLPVLAVPSGMGPQGLPTGIQIVARSFDDSRVFRVAAALEQAQPWLDTPDRRPKI